MSIDEIMSFDDIIEYLDAVKYDLTPGDDITLTTPEDDLLVELWWHSPSLNLGWYPIIRVEDNNGVLLNREGTENPNGWYHLIDTAIDKIGQAYDSEPEDEIDDYSYGQHSEEWYIAQAHGEDTDPFM